MFFDDAFRAELRERGRWRKIHDEVTATTANCIAGCLAGIANGYGIGKETEVPSREAVA